MQLKSFLEERVEKYNTPTFIQDDPIQIPHQFSKKQDIEIMGFWTAMLAWGQRKTIINKAKELIQLMDGSPHDFIVNHQESDRNRFLHFKHRTFQLTDTLYFLEFFQQFYRQHDSLEEGFAQFITPQDKTVERALKGFHHLFFALPNAPRRTRKHLSTPERKSACKRLNMFLRWMVRQDNKGVDLGIWKRLQPSQLLLPLDVHVDRVGRKLGLITRKQRDWLTVLELTDNLRAYDPEDPAKYDFALFGLGVLQEI